MRYSKPRVMLVALALLALLAPAAPAQSAREIDPGMTQEQVIERLGQPMGVRTYGSVTYLFYRNGCEKTCGMNDLVVLDSNKVIDAIFRAPARKYTGASSSPRAISAREARHGTADPPLAVPSKKPKP